MLESILGMINISSSFTVRSSISIICRQAYAAKGTPMSFETIIRPLTHPVREAGEYLMHDIPQSQARRDAESDLEDPPFHETFNSAIR